MIEAATDAVHRLSPAVQVKIETLGAPLGTHIHHAWNVMLNGGSYGKSNPGICISVEITDDPSEYGGEWPVTVSNAIASCHRPSEHGSLDENCIELLQMPVGAHFHIGHGAIILNVDERDMKTFLEGVCVRSIERLNPGEDKEFWKIQMRAFRPLEACSGPEPFVPLVRPPR